MTQTTCPSCERPDVGPGRACRWCSQLLNAPNGIKLASIGQRLGAFLLDTVLVFVTLIIGYLIWWLIVMAQGQTPGKQIVGIRVYHDHGIPAAWGRTFLREFVAKWITGIIIGWFFSIDKLWALWDQDRQALYDKISSTIVVDDRQMSRTSV